MEAGKGQPIATLMHIPEGLQSVPYRPAVAGGRKPGDADDAGKAALRPAGPPGVWK